MTRQCAKFDQWWLIFEVLGASNLGQIGQAQAALRNCRVRNPALGMITGPQYMSQRTTHGVGEEHLVGHWGEVEFFITGRESGSFEVLGSVKIPDELDSLYRNLIFENLILG